MWDNYTLTTSCSAINNETRNPDGTFDFLEDPNIPANDPLICTPSSNLELEPLTATNVGSPYGRLSPEGDQFSISGLRFEYSDSVVTAALEVDIQGQYDARRPNAQITRVAAPEGCDEPVSLLATSWDADRDPLTHSWWVRDIGSLSGPLLEVPLPAGEHVVMLTSGDGSGLFDSETLRYARNCR
jgi:hypothetical protein